MKEIPEIKKPVPTNVQRRGLASEIREDNKRKDDWANIYSKWYANAEIKIDQIPIVVDAITAP